MIQAFEGPTRWNTPASPHAMHCHPRCVSPHDILTRTTGVCLLPLVARQPTGNHSLPVRVTAYASLLVRTTPSLFVAFGISCTLHVCHQ
jgi:hypothetical protein